MSDDTRPAESIDRERTREALREHLNEIEDRVNPKKVANRVVDRAQDSYNENPTPWFAAAAGIAVVVVGSIVLAIVRRR